MSYLLNRMDNLNKNTVEANLVSCMIACIISAVIMIAMVLNEEPIIVPLPVIEPIESAKTDEPKKINMMPEYGILIQTKTPTPEPTIGVEIKKLTKRSGVAYGPSGKETYYNLKMDGVVKIMRKAGYTEEEYPYNVREDGVKCLGPYIMVAANLEKHPRGSLVETTLGTGIVCDTGTAMIENPDMIDIAVNW